LHQFDYDVARAYAKSITIPVNEKRGFPMAKLALIYGMRLFPEDELGEVTEATVTLKNGKTARVSMHLIDGSKEEIEETLRQSVAAFFEMYPEI
jgi:hypothetical protein